MKLHFPETWKIGIFQYVTSGPVEFWRGVHNVRLHLEGKIFLNLWCSLKMQFLGMSPSHKMSFTWKVPQVWCLFPVWKQEKKATFKTKLMEAFPNNPNVDGWGARKCNLQFASPRIPMSMVTTYLAYSSFGMHNKDAQQCGLHQRGASTRNMLWGGMKTRIPYPGNPSALKTNCSFCFNSLLVILRYTMLTVNRSNQ